MDIKVYTDSDWAGCSKTRKSTSGVVLQILGCIVTALSRTQQVLALSSGEAELYAMGTGVLEALRLRSFLVESGLASRIDVTLHTDSSAAKSMASRFGATRRTRHIELRCLYLQNLIQSGTIRLSKIAGSGNVSDIMTKYVSSEILRRHVSSLGLVHMSDT